MHIKDHLSSKVQDLKRLMEIYPEQKQEIRGIFSTRLYTALTSYVPGKELELMKRIDQVGAYISGSFALRLVDYDTQWTSEPEDLDIYVLKGQSETLSEAICQVSPKT